MNKTLIILMFSYFVFMVFLLLIMFVKRRSSLIKKEIRLSHFKSYNSESSEELIILQNHFNNQFQMPVIFMIVCSLAIQQNAVDNIILGCAIFFIFSRVIHSYIHLGYNNVLHRAFSYFLGILAIVMIWIKLLIN